jgi:hypothetical protein
MAIGLFALYMRSFALGFAIGSLSFLIVGGLLIWYYQFWISRIPFASVILESVTTVISSYAGATSAGILGLILQSAFGVYFLVTILGIAKFSFEKNISQQVYFALVLYTLFVFYWTSQVIRNTVHVTICGLFGTYYLQGIADETGKVTIPVRNPTIRAAKRALTTSFGSICYGSLLIAVMQPLKAIVHMARSEDHDDNLARAVLLCCIECIVSVLSDLLEYFNKYAFVQVRFSYLGFCIWERLLYCW